MSSKLKIVTLTFAVLSSVSTVIFPKASADIFCWPGEKNCVRDGRIGTSGNDIFGNSGGNTIQKGAALLDKSLGTGGVIQGGVNKYYEPNKRAILDCVGSAIAPSMPGYLQGSIDTSRCKNQAPVRSMPVGPATPLPGQSGSVEMGGWQSPNNPGGGTIESIPGTNMQRMSRPGGMGGMPGMGGMGGMPGMGGYN